MGSKDLSLWATIVRQQNKHGRRDDRVGGEKREMEGNGRIYIIGVGRAHLAIYPAVPATQHRPPTFSLSFSLRGIHFYYRGLNRDLPLPSLHTPHSLLCSCPGHNLPLSSDIFTSAPHATAYQTSPITSSNPISDLPIPAHLTPNLASSSPHLILPHLPTSCLYPLPSSPHSAPPCASSRLPRVFSDQSALNSAFQ